MRHGFNDMTDVLSNIKSALKLTDLQEQMTALSRFYYRVEPSRFEKLDPFGASYKERVLGVYGEISRNSTYDAAVMEKNDALDDVDISTCPFPYRFKDSRSVGEHLMCYGWILRVLDVRNGADTLEYGAGEGQLAMHLARMGCNVHAIDIEPRFLEAIRKQCDAIGIQIQMRTGKFGDGFDGKKFDRVMFFEAFHHCFEHLDALMRIRELLKPEGFISFSGEPIMPDNSPDLEVLPYPWGLRLDGESVRSIAEFGWMELGYSEGYFVELLARAGYSTEVMRCPGAWRADTYIGRPFDTRYPVERNTLIRVYSGDAGWYDSEGTHRWTNGHALFPLPHLGHRKVKVGLSNLGPGRTCVAISCQDRSSERRIASGETTFMTIDLPDQPGNLHIDSDTFQPSVVSQGSSDTRVLGVAVNSIEFLM
ncbi:MAG TPA: class I SAM-dependent methyltransferase [Paraburkholderia sp.]|jgi:2-polyprenyl-3-methyl-5-hydroxy-6-metoxy-1,4-benzoquinol methylase|nr:class I SAM-dependent methyltransferase [Paraburkholderia sp.]